MPFIVLPYTYVGSLDDSVYSVSWTGSMPGLPHDHATILLFFYFASALPHLHTFHALITMRKDVTLLA